MKECSACEKSHGCDRGLAIKGSTAVRYLYLRIIIDVSSTALAVLPFTERVPNADVKVDP